jgi:hypothetical protein
MTDDSQCSEFTIPTFSRGAWSDRPFPVVGYGHADDLERDHNEVLKEFGYVRFTELNDRRGSLSLIVWRWEGPQGKGSPRDPHPTGGALYLIDITGDGGYQTVAAADVADMMDVLARWAPALQTDILEAWKTQSIVS